MSDKKIIPAQDVFTKFEDELAFVMKADSSDYDFLELDELSSVIWKHISETKGCTRKEILDEVHDQYDGDLTDLSEKLELMIEELKTLHIIHEV